MTELQKFIEEYNTDSRTTKSYASQVTDTVAKIYDNNTNKDKLTITLQPDSTLSFIKYMQSEMTYSKAVEEAIKILHK